MISIGGLRSVILFNGGCKSIVAKGMVEVKKGVQASFACSFGTEDFGRVLLYRDILTLSFVQLYFAIECKND